MTDRIKAMRNPNHRMENWDIEEECSIEVDVSYFFSKDIDRALTEEQKDTLAHKRAIVERSAKRMMAGMIKGTLKYSRSDLTQEEWLNYVFDEGCDLQNFIGLLKFYSHSPTDE